MDAEEHPDSRDGSKRPRDPIPPGRGAGAAVQAPLADAASFLRLETQYVARSAWRELSALYRDRIAGISDPAEKADLLARLAELLEDELHDLHGAADVYKAWVQLNGDPHALEEQLRILQQLETVSGVRRAIDEAVENASDDQARAMALTARAEAALIREELDHAAADFEAALELDPGRLKAQAGLAEAKAARGDTEPLRAMVQTVSALPRHDRERADLFRRLARAADRFVADLDVARVAWTEVLADVSFDPEAQDRLAGIARRLEDGQSLELALRSKIRRDPHAPDAKAARIELAALLERDGRRAAAMDELMQSVRLDPGHREAWLVLVERYLEEGDDGRAAWALEHAATATEDESARADLWDRLATHCRERLRDGGRALVYSTRAAGLRRNLQPPEASARQPILSKLPRAVAGLRPPSWEKSEPGFVPGGADPRPSGEKPPAAREAELAALLGNSGPVAAARISSPGAPAESTRPTAEVEVVVPPDARKDTVEARVVIPPEARPGTVDEADPDSLPTPPPDAMPFDSSEENPFESPATVEFELPFAAAGTLLSSTAPLPAPPPPPSPALPGDPRFASAPTLAIPAQELAAFQKSLESQRRAPLRPLLDPTARTVEMRITPSAGVPAASFEEPTAPRVPLAPRSLPPDVAGPHDLDLEQLSGALERYEAAAGARRHAPRTEEFELTPGGSSSDSSPPSEDERRAELFAAVRENPLDPDPYQLLAEFFDRHGDVERGDLMAEIATALESVPEAPPRVPRLILSARDRAGLRHPLLRNEAGELLGLSGLALCHVFPMRGRAAGSRDLFHLETGPGAQAAADAVLAGVRILGLRAPDIYLAEDAGPPLSLAFPGSLRLLVGRAALRKALPGAELRFFAGRALFTQAADLLALRSLSLEELQAGFAALGEALFAGKRVSREAATVREFLAPKVVPRLKELYPRVKETLEVEALAEGARHSANRAGLVVAGGVAPALAALRAKKALDEEMAELVRFAASERYLKLRARRIPG